ncbi:hypothetical protein M413DRAFT_25141 [Hebeloma cylindrosporum]|uniref:ZW10 C-terminal helical domain-containing protein n=1 Tax=Hebeloma cylindrosporum TaxID=76867 RepID=A0A0C2YUM6_HEBCY|nr:hypothetical protein M413DRAFT_25141 [Hebeloma cylindrosporum h7]
MAFPVPDHLPKRPTPVDVSSTILYKIDSATKDTLNSSLAASWIHELDESIQATKQSIHDRIQSDLPKFRRQLETAKSVQTRFNSLTNRVDSLNDAISNPETGILPTLLATLQAHSILAQESSDVQIIYEGFHYLLQCKDSFSLLTSLAQLGKLPEAVVAVQEFDHLMERMPIFVQDTQVAEDLKRKFNATKARLQDQLSDAYTRTIIISSTQICVNPVVRVRQSDTMLELPSILHSLSPASLSNHLSTLRRDLLVHFIDRSLKQPCSLSITFSESQEAKVVLTPTSPNNEDLGSRLDNASKILDFLSSNILCHLPRNEFVQLSRSLSKPVTSSVLDNLLLPALPSSFGLLPSYLGLLKRAVSFEERDISKLFESDKNEGTIKAWADGVSGHYERRRRIEILESARKEILEHDDPMITFEAISDDGPETSLPSVVPVQIEDDVPDDAWGFDEPGTANPVEQSADGWGFDDDIDEDVEAEPEGDTHIDTSGKEPMDIDPPEMTVADPDPADAWGWNDEDELPAEEIPEDNPWDDDPWSDPPETNSVLESPPLPVVPAKAATRLERLASKNKKHVNGHSAQISSLPSSPAPASGQTIIFTPPSPKPEPISKSTAKRFNSTKRPADVVTTIAPRETYKVPKRTKRVLKMVETVIDESKLFYASKLFPMPQGSSATPGTVLSQCAPSILDLYQALYPNKFCEDLKSPELAMLFSNSCIYMADSVQRIEDTIFGQPVLKERLKDCRHQLQILGNSWFHDTVDQQRQHVDGILVEGAQGFTYTGDQDRYDECETAVNEALKAIKRLAPRLKGILTKSKYYSAIGSVADAALSRILRDIIALPDIPEIESHRLSELCRILNAMEGLFSEDPDQPSFVVAYVPSWLKFSYLSELLEASLADISYLFEQGALVDFQVNELVNLVRALFADTSLRTNTINKLLNGHPVAPQ